jgi:hypothetical protein
MWKIQVPTSDIPIKAFDLIGQCRTRTIVGNLHLERVPLNLRRHRATKHEVGLSIVRRWTEYQCRPMASLLMSSLRIEV